HLEVFDPPTRRAAPAEQRVPERLHTDTERAHHADAGDDDVAAHASRPSTSVTLCPPKPYDEVRATPSGCRRPAVGTRSRSLPAGSGSRSVAVGGRSEPASASPVATAITATRGARAAPS